jgi:hypothetical protein
MIRSFAPRLVCSVAALSLLWSGAEARPVPVKGTKPAVAAASVQPARPWLYQNSDVPIDTAWLFGTLPNGLRYAIRRNGVPPGQVSIRMRVDAGSLYERPQESGYAHFIEHLTFRGSKFVPDGESKRLWQRLGVSFGSDSTRRRPRPRPPMRSICPMRRRTVSGEPQDPLRHGERPQYRAFGGGGGTGDRARRDAGECGRGEPG